MTITDTSFSVGTSVSTHTGIARVDLTGGVSDNVIDASGVTTGGSVVWLRILGQGGDDTLIGSELDDQIRDSGGANTIDGRGGRDTLVIDSDADLTLTNTTIAIGTDVGTHTSMEDIRLSGGSGDSVFDASAVDGATGVEIIFLIGNAGDDTLIGSRLADVFSENLGNNTITGGGQLPGTRDRLEFRVDSDMTATSSPLTMEPILLMHLLLLWSL